MAEFELKDWFNEDRYRKLATELLSLTPKFDQKAFLHLTITQLAERSLMQRMRQTSLALGETLPGEYRQQVAILKELAPKVGHNFVACFLSDFVGVFGSNDADFSLNALRFFTPFGSSEFAVREFLALDLKGTLHVMQAWAVDDNEHVRRLASEGCRPRLPWGRRLSALVIDPTPTLTLLNGLKMDDSLYVRKSVANHYNDIAKDNPDIVLAELSAWDLREPKLKWIATQALRTLVKAGDVQALKILGFSGKTSVNAQVAVKPKNLVLGDRLTIQSQITSAAKVTQTLAIDYVIHYMKASGKSAPKVFKWSQVTLAAGETLQLTKTQVIKDFTTRKHHLGAHKVELQINGQRLGQAQFTLISG